MQEAILKEILEAVKTVNTRLTSIEDRLVSLEDRMTSLEDRMTSLEDRVTSLEDRATSLEDRMTSVEKQLEELPLIKQAVLETQKDVVELKEKGNHFDTVLSQQQQVIELLSIKTIEHEARLKWAR